ncbi:hypothetical protein LCGC14_2784730 [marine sediment metagenome]|uniref:Uncharacterized protein n=1 Tax=marine sediment metagenome TaxID=412755 RepID=A0A0F9BIQ6_9ZZZZ
MTTINNAIIDRLIRREGGFVDNPADRGGPTKYGITMTALREWFGREPTAGELEALTQADAHDIYCALYVMKPRFNRIDDERLREQVIDAGVLHGRGWASRRLQEVVGVTADGLIGPITLRAVNFGGKTNGLGHRFMQRRIHRIGRIVQRDHTQIVFLTGWLDRASSFLET